MSFVNWGLGLSLDLDLDLELGWLSRMWILFGWVLSLRVGFKGVFMRL